jgi:hypothetical protein
MSASELPIPDWDGLPFGDLASRVRALEVGDLRALREHEKEHAHRVQVLQVLEQRIGELEQGASVSDGDPASRRPGTATAPASENEASPATQGPPVNPPSHGDPTNPAQPRR